MPNSVKNRNPKLKSVLIANIPNLKNITKLQAYQLLMIIGIIIVFTPGFANNNAKRQVIIAFDDGYYAIFKYAYPILKKYDVPITLALITSYLESGKIRAYASPYRFMNVQEIQEMVNSLKIEIASHSVTHRNLTKLNPTEVQNELTHSKHVLDSLFNQETVTFVYPYGAQNPQIIEQTKAAGYKLGRSVRWGEPNLWVDRYLIPIKEVRSSTSVQELINHIKYHKTTVLLFHRIVPQPAYFTDWSQNNFNRLIQALKYDPEIKCLTLKDLYQQWWQDIMAKYLIKKGWQYNPVLFQKVDIDQTRTFYPNTGQ